MVNTWGNELTVRNVYKTALELADIIGINLYLKHPFPIIRHIKTYIGPFQSKETIKKVGEEIKAAGKEFWITELQTEPWEPEELVTKKENPPSFLPEHFKENLEYAKYLEPDVVLFWGFEYWCWRKTKGDLRYWTTINRTISTLAKKQH